MCNILKSKARGASRGSFRTADSMTTVPATSQELLESTPSPEAKRMAAMAMISKLEASLAALKLDVSSLNSPPAPSASPAAHPKALGTPSPKVVSGLATLKPPTPSTRKALSTTKPSQHGDIRPEGSTANCQEPMIVEPSSRESPRSFDVMNGGNGTLVTPNPSVMALQHIAKLPDGETKSALMALCEAHMVSNEVWCVFKVIHIMLGI